MAGLRQRNEVEETSYSMSLVEPVDTSRVEAVCMSHELGRIQKQGSILEQRLCIA